LHKYLSAFSVLFNCMIDEDLES